MNITTLLQQQASLRPEAIAILETRGNRDRCTSFAALETAIAKTVALLRQQGLQAGDPVLLFCPMSAELYIILGALFRLGLMAMVLDPSSGREHLEQCCRLCPPQALIAQDRVYGLMVRSAALRQIPRKISVGFPIPGTVAWDQSRWLEPDWTMHPCTPETPALLTFTSGSTGEPKAALRTHGFMLQQYRALIPAMQLEAGAIEVAALHMLVLPNLASGLTTLIPKGNLRHPGTLAAAPILRQLQRHRPDRIVAAPGFLQRLIDYALPQNLTLASIQRVFCGGAPIMPRLLEQLQQVFPNSEIKILYGSAEAEPIASIPLPTFSPEDHMAMRSGKGLLVGTPVPEIQVKILAQQWGQSIAPYSQIAFLRDCLPPHQVGEIVVTGDHVLQSYWQGRGDREIKFQVEQTIWHRTGDAGYFDDSGRLWLMGRCQARIEDEKGVLYPFAVECVVQQHPAVRRSAIVLHRGTRLLVVEPVQPRTALDLAAIQDSIAWAKIDAIQVIPKIPLDYRHNAKIAYPELFTLLNSNGLRARREAPK